ncbi:hypothetical protein [Kitasatospora griseola]|uniref:hypothetical protein n=1 Tax=Kitasatospora griseola TaxID=2064 RepID=UPI0016711EFC|nr:hypothetical protein [Kitasatospora griseola]GGQ57348.1 hypothetical protein GCM10010195_11330 [Kitasatospora griseola]
MNRTGIGCLTAALLVAAAVLMVFSVSATIEIEGPPELNPGFHDNRTVLAAVVLGTGLYLALAGLVLGLHGSGGAAGRTAVAILVLPLLAFGVFRLTVLAPMLACDGTSIAQEAPGSYDCEDITY